MLSKVLTVKIFGITQDENLTYNDHENTVTTKMSKLVHCLVYSHPTYAIYTEHLDVLILSVLMHAQE